MRFQLISNFQLSSWSLENYVVKCSLSCLILYITPSSNDISTHELCSARAEPLPISYQYKTPPLHSHDLPLVGRDLFCNCTFELTSIWCVTVSADQQHTRKTIIFQDNLMNDSTAWFPKPNTIFCRGCS